MGSERSCEASFRVGSARGKALLEADHLLFRDDRTRLRIEFSSLSSVHFQGGELSLAWSDGEITLKLGEPDAERWAEKILNPTPTAVKLGLKNGVTLALSGELPADLSCVIDSAGVELNHTVPALADIVFHGVTESSDLLELPYLQASIRSDAAVWVVWQKGKAGLVKESEVLASARASGLVDLKIVSISPTHTAMKFVVTRKDAVGVL